MLPTVRTDHDPDQEDPMLTEFRTKIFATATEEGDRPALIIQEVDQTWIVNPETGDRELDESYPAPTWDEHELAHVDDADAQLVELGYVTVGEWQPTSDGETVEVRRL